MASVAIDEDVLPKLNLLSYITRRSAKAIVTEAVRIYLKSKLPKEAREVMKSLEELRANTGEQQ